jgi:hypothetical protein
MESNGDSVYYSPKVGAPWDWDLNPNGYLSHWTNATFDVLDSNYNVIDNYVPKNGYGTDVHEFTLTKDNHAWMITDNPQVINMKVYNASYCQNATVVGTVIQEQDEDHNLLFEWHSFDHIDVTEAAHENLASCYIDYMHTNSLDFDADGNILTSNRHLDQLNYIDKNTGEFIWRLGGDSNQFVFTNDAEKFTYEHCARFLENGNITLWDNGNFHSPSHSMAKEYQIDAINKTATLVWSYQPKTYTSTNGYWFAMGSTQRLPNGNTFMNGGWDFSSNQSNIFEVDPAGNVVWELALDNGKSLVGYRAWRHEWNPCAPINPDAVTVTKITSTSAKVSWNAVSNATSYDIQYRKAKNTEWKIKNTTKTSKKLSNLASDLEYVFQIRTYCANGHVSDWSPIDTFKTLPARMIDPQNTIAASMELSPNPTSGFINIEFELDNNETVTVSLFDITGKLISTSVQSLTQGDQQMQFDVSNFPAGLYYAEVIAGSEKNILKFVKQ